MGLLSHIMIPDTTDHIEVPYAKACGIGPGVLSNAVADITVMLFLMTMCRVEEGTRHAKDSEVGYPCEVDFRLAWDTSAFGELQRGCAEDEDVARDTDVTGCTPPKISLLQSNAQSSP